MLSSCLIGLGFAVSDSFSSDSFSSFHLQAGAKFIVFTTKHCDGWTHWRSPAKYGYNSMDAGPKRDVRTKRGRVRVRDWGKCQ